MSNSLLSSSTVSFADVAHQTLLFDRRSPSSELLLRLIDTAWVQRLRTLKQTGNTNFVYMFAEHSRFGHSLGAAYLATLLMDQLARFSPDLVEPYRMAVSASALLHDIGHCAPGSHLAEHLWLQDSSGTHEEISRRVIVEDPEISQILEDAQPGLSSLVASILDAHSEVPPWTHAVISGGGWNVDRGNWAIVDSAMCSVSYGRYNVRALIDAFRLSPAGELVLHENRLDALTHFYVARDSMYRQVYQHRVLQAADAMTGRLVVRARDLIAEEFGLGTEPQPSEIEAFFGSKQLFCDGTMAAVLASKNYGKQLSLPALFNMTEGWWRYHLERWCLAGDDIMRDLALRLRDRKLLKTIRLDLDSVADGDNREARQIVDRASEVASSLGFDPRYYVLVVENMDRHRRGEERPPQVLRDNGSIVPVTEVESLIQVLQTSPARATRWLVVPKAVKEKLGRIR